MRNSSWSCIFMVFALFVFVDGKGVWAQAELSSGAVATPSETLLAAPETNAEERQEGEVLPVGDKSPVSPPLPLYRSLFLTEGQQRSLLDVRNFRGDFYNDYMMELTLQRKRDQQQDALDATKPQVEERIKPPPEARYIHLQGIVYTSPDDWVVWMNGQRITPGALPKEVLGFKVYQSYVEMQWFDAYTNKVIPLRLRPMQRFHIDSRMFLPG